MQVSNGETNFTRLNIKHIFFSNSTKKIISKAKEKH